MQQAARIADKTAFFLLDRWLSTVIQKKCSLCLRTREQRTILQGGSVKCVDIMTRSWKIFTIFWWKWAICARKPFLWLPVYYRMKMRPRKQSIKRKKKLIRRNGDRAALYASDPAPAAYCIGPAPDWRCLKNELQIWSVSAIRASDIADLARFISGKEKQGESQGHLWDMAQATVKMVTDSVTSFVNDDYDLALQVMKSDDRVDSLFEKIKCDIIDMIRNNQVEAESSLDLLMAAKYFERIGDHAVNIAEWVEYSITGGHENKEGLTGENCRVKNKSSVTRTGLFLLHRKQCPLCNKKASLRMRTHRAAAPYMKVSSSVLRTFVAV